MSDPVSALRAVSGNDPASGATGLPNIPSVPMGTDPAMTNILSVMKSWMELAAGNGLTGFASKQELIDAGVLKSDESGKVIGQIDLTIPPVPTGLMANGAMTNILVQWDTPVGKYRNHAYTEVWASGVDDFSQAVMIGQAGGFVFSHAVGEDSTRYYWIRFVSTAGIKGPFNSVSGTKGSTSKDPSYLLSVLQGQIAESQLNKSLNNRINLIDAPATVLGSLAYQILQEANARGTAIQSEATTRAAADGSLSSQITTLTAFVNDNAAAIQSEASARANADAAEATARQTLAATVNGNTAAIQSEATTRAAADGSLFAQYTVKTDVNGYVSGFGLASTLKDATPYSQFIFKADQLAFGAPGLASVYPFVIQATATTINGVDVPAGVYIDAAYIKNGSITTAQIKNATIDSAQITGKLTANQINADQLNVTNGTFSGQLIGATGTFSGNLAAASGTFIGELIAATGTFGGRLMAGVLDLGSLTGITEYRSSPGTYYFTLSGEESRIRYQLMAGGGGGGAGKGGEWNTPAGGGGGGGAGEYKTGTFELSPGTQIRAIVGSGGIGASSWAAAGAAGTYSSIAYWNGSSWVNLVVANPGGGGAGAPIIHYDNADGDCVNGGGGGGYPSGGSGPNGDVSEGGSATGGRGATTVWGSGGSPGYPNIGWGSNGSGFGAGGGGGAGYHAWRNSGADWNHSLFGGGGAGMGGKAVIEFYNPNTVVLRSEYIALDQRVTAIEQRLQTAGIP